MNKLRVGDTIDIDIFTSLVKKYSGNKISDQDIVQAFKSASKG
jgi:hypothetical protein